MFCFSQYEFFREAGSCEVLRAIFEERFLLLTKYKITKKNDHFKTTRLSRQRVRSSFRLDFVGRAGIEPATSCLSSMRSKPTELTPLLNFFRYNYPCIVVNSLATMDIHHFRVLPERLQK